MDIHNSINSLVLIALTVVFFIQQKQLGFLKSISDMYQPDKLKQANDLIFQGKEYEYKFKLRTEAETITKQVSTEFQKLHSEFYNRYNELIDLPMNFLIHKTDEQREIFLKNYPLNSSLLRKLLEDYDNENKKS